MLDVCRAKVSNKWIFGDVDIIIKIKENTLEYGAHTYENNKCQPCPNKIDTVIFR